MNLNVTINKATTPPDSDRMVVLNVKGKPTCGYYIETEGYRGQYYNRKSGVSGWTSFMPEFWCEFPETPFCNDVEIKVGSLYQAVRPIMTTSYYGHSYVGCVNDRLVNSIIGDTVFYTTPSLQSSTSLNSFKNWAAFEIIPSQWRTWATFNRQKETVATVDSNGLKWNPGIHLPEAQKEVAMIVDGMYTVGMYSKHMGYRYMSYGRNGLGRYYGKPEYWRDLPSKKGN